MNRIILTVFLLTLLTVKFSAQTVTTQLYLSDPSQALDRIDPVASADGTTTSTGLLSGIYTPLAVVNTKTNSSSDPGSTTFTVANVVVGAGENRGMIVGISQRYRTINSVTYGGVALDPIGVSNNGSNARVCIYGILNPTVGTANLVVTLDANPSNGIVVGVTNFVGVNQTIPLGTFASATGNSNIASVNVSSAIGELVYDAVSYRNNITVGPNQTQLYNINAGIRGGASTEIGANSVTMSWTASSARWAIAAIPVKPAPLTVNNTTFSLSPTLCSPITIKAGTISVSNYITVTSGTMPTNPSITAELKYGANNIITLSNPTYNSITGLLTWSGNLASDKTIPAGQSIDLIVTTTLAGVNFTIDYDSSTKPSKVQFLTSTYVNVNSIELYDAAYPGGHIVTQLTPNSTYYARINVSNPFGAYDINGGSLTLTNNLGSSPVTLGAANLKNTSACLKTYEVPFTVPTGATTYSFTALAKQGLENTVTHTTSLNAVPVVRIIAVNDEIRINNGEIAVVNVLANDKGDLDPLSVTIDANPQHGTLVNNGNGEISYLPNGNFSGNDAYVYSVCTTGSPVICTTGIVYIEVLPDLSSPCNEATLSKTYYLPYPENTTQLFEALYQASNNYSYPNPLTIRSITSLKVPYPGTIIYFDHWEDGYETDITQPIQTTTQIWGDGNLSNGVAPGFPNDIFPAGANLVLDNTFLINSRDGSNPTGIYFDGKDKILSTADVALSKVSGVASQFSVQTVKTAVFDVTRFGKLFRLGIGEIVGVQYLNYASVFITAQYNGTIVKLDLDNNGSTDVTSPTLNEGQVWFYQGNPLSTAVATATDLKPGTVITANQPVGVDLVLGDNLNFGTRNVNVLPDKFASNTYYTPVPTTLGTAPSVVYFVNNGNAAITINWQSGVPASGSVSVAAKGYATLTLANSANAAYKFSSAGGQPFVAYQIMDADATSADYDWAFSLLGAERLTNFTSVAWAPGSVDGTRNDNPVWITPTANTTVYVKWDGNLIIPPGYTGQKTINNIPYDQAVQIDALKYYKFYNPSSSNDQSGAAFFTDEVPFAGVYGQDANKALAGPPSLDVGTIMPPRCLKRLMIAVDDYVNTQIDVPVTIDIKANDEGYLCSKDLGSISTSGLLQPANGTIIINANGTITYTPNLGFTGTDFFEYRICSIESPVVCDVAKVQVTVTDCNATATENRINGKVYLEQLPDDGAYSVGETFVNGVRVDLYADTDCSGTINGTEKVFQSTITDLSGNFSFITVNGFYAKDSFDPTASFTGNIGSVDWTNSWTEQGDDSNIGAGDIRILEDNFFGGITNAIRLAGNANGISRSLNFNAATSATLRFKYRRQTITAAAAQLIVKINGTQVYAIDYGGGVGTDNYYAEVILPLTSYSANGSNTVQFITNGSVGTADYYWIDDVELLYFKNPACFITKVNSSNTNGAFTEALLNKQTSSFTGIGACDNDNWLGVKANMVASPDNAFTATDIPVVIDVLANDVVGTPNPSTVTTAGLIQPANGTVTVNPNGTITYTPNPGFDGTNTFQYQVCSALEPSVCSITTVSVTVSCISIPGKNVITGKVYSDVNANGILNVGENGEPAVGVNLYTDTNRNGVLDGTEGTTPLLTTSTSSVGGYEFSINTPTYSNTYLDQFDVNNIANGTNGTAAWTSNWVQIGETDGFGTGSIDITAANGLKLSGKGDGNVRGALRTADLSNAFSATLSYTATKSGLDDSNDWVEVYVASSTSGPWTTLVERLELPNGAKNTTFTIPTNLLSATTTIRFVTSGNGNMSTGDIIYFDNVQISFESISKTYLDYFTANTTANQTNGTTSWSGNSWTEIGESNGFATNNITITAANSLKITGSGNATILGAYRTVPLLEAGNATLSYTSTGSGLDGVANDWVDVQVASSTSGPWTQLEKISTNTTSNSNLVIPSNLISATTTIRFVSSGLTAMTSSDIVYFDNVQVSYTPKEFFIVQLSQPISSSKYLTSPSPSPTGTHTVSFTGGSGQGNCSNNFGLSQIIADNDINQTIMNVAVTGQLLTNDEGLTAVSTASIGGSPFVLGTAKQVSGKDEYGNTIANAGSLTINSDGTYNFTPTAGFVGTIDPVTYTGIGGGVTSNKAILSIEVIPAVQPGNNPPTAQNDVNTTEINTSIISKVLSNDSDPDGDIIKVTKVETIVTTNNGTTETFTNIVLNSPSTITVSGVNSSGVKVDNAGTLKFEDNGTYTFVPATGFIGTVNNITYTISDGRGGTDTAILNLSVINNTGNNTFANDDANSAPKRVTITGNVKTNDFDPEGHTQTVTAQTLTSTSGNALTNPVFGKGALTLNTNGTYTFVPLSTFVGTVAVKYTTCDNGTPQACDEATLYLTSIPIIVFADNDINQTTINTPVSGQVLTNDEGVNTVSSVLVGATPYTVPAGATGVTVANVPGKDKNGGTVSNAGSLTFKADGTYIFTPTSGFVGTIDPITYTGTGAGGATDNAILSIEVIPMVQPGNNPPTAQNDVNTTEINKPISSTLLSNDSDPDNDALVVSKVIIGGTTYTSLPQTSISVSGINAAGATVPAGTITINSDGSYNYVPESTFIGTVNDITYTISDGKGGTDTAILSISVINNFGNNTFANDDANSAPKGATMTGNILTNDFDPEGNTQTVSTASALFGGITTSISLVSATLIPGVGTLTLSSTGAYSFIPLASFTGTVPVKYNKCDNGTPPACDEATLYLTSLPVFYFATDDINQTPSGKAVSGDLLINDKNLTDITQVSFGGGAPVSVPTSGTVTLNLPGYGSIELSADGTYTFTPTGSYIGSLPAISYTATNENGDTDNAKLYINVVDNYNPTINNAPVANHDVATVKQGTSVTVYPLTNDSDPDGNTLTVSTISYNGTAISTNGGTPTTITVGAVTAGTAYKDASGNLVFIANASYVGDVPFTYAISDGKGGTATSTINVTVTPFSSSSIVANDDAKVAPQGEGMSGNVLINDKTIGTTTVVSGNVTFDDNDTPLVVNTPTTIDGVGVITLNSNGTYIFIPLPNFVGTVPVVYNISNGTSTDQATLYLTSIPMVEATDDINQTPAGISVSGNLLTNDKGLSKITTISINGGTPVAIPNGGSTTLTFEEGVLLVNSDGTYTFTPAIGYVGDVPPITYTATNSDGGTDNAKLYIGVVSSYNPGAGINNAPVANHDVATTKQSVEVTVKPLSNDSDPDASAILSITKIKDGQGNVITATTIGTAQTVKNIDGTAVGTAYIVGNELKFTPNASYVGDVPFTYEIKDNNAVPKIASSTITITVLPAAANLAGIYANDDANVKPKDVDMSGNVLNNDESVIAGLQVSAASVTMGVTTTMIPIGTPTTIFDGATALGVLTLNTGGGYTFNPEPTFEGTIPVVYTVKNNDGDTDQATLYLTSLPEKKSQVWIGTTDDVWNSGANWKSGSVPIAGDDVEFATLANNPLNPSDLNNPKYGIAKNDLTVPSGVTKTVGNLTNESSKALVIPAGTAVIVNEKIFGSESSLNPNRLILEADALKPNGSLVVGAGCGTTVYATIQLYAKGDSLHSYSWTDNIAGSPTLNTVFKGKYSWQFFGVPVESIVADPTFYRGFLREYDEKKNSGTSYYNKWIDLENSSELKAFKGYEVTQDNPTIYEIKGKLMLCDQEITLTRQAVEVADGVGGSGGSQANIENKRYGLGQNVVGNSFTAAIPIDQIDFDNVKYDGSTVSNASGNHVEKTVYLYNTGSFGEWTTGTSNTEIATAGTYRAIPSNVAVAVYTQIPSMQGFLLRHLMVDNTYGTGTGKDIKMTLPYNKLIKNDKPQTAPKAQLSYLEMHLKGSSTMDQLWLFSQPGTSSAFDNGWDGRKFFGRSAAYIFALSEAGNMQVNTTDNLIGTRIAFVPDGSKSYEMTIRKSNLGEYNSLYLADLFTGAVAELKNELTTFYFTSSGQTGKDEQRFRIVASADRSTWKDNVYLNAYSEGKNIYLSNWTNHIGTMSLYDMSGRKLIELQIPALIDKVFPVNLERGAYVIQMNAGEHQFSTKCIIR